MRGTINKELIFKVVVKTYRNYRGIVPYHELGSVTKGAND